MHTFHINVFIQFLASSTCFEHNVFIIRKTISMNSFAWYVFTLHASINLKCVRLLVYVTYNITECTAQNIKFRDFFCYLHHRCQNVIQIPPKSLVTYNDYSVITFETNIKIDCSQIIDNTPQIYVDVCILTP
jgi:hypothetical protein